MGWTDKNISGSEAFYEHQLSVSSKFIRSAAAIAAAFNLLLIFPDVVNITEPDSRCFVFAYRSAMILAAVLLIVFTKRIKTFKKLALIITAYELATAFIFFHIYALYPHPDFTIQLLGTLTIIMAVFLVPNMWANMLALSVLTGAGFLVYSYLRIGVGGAGIDIMHFTAAAAYIAIETALFSVFMLNHNRYKRSEFFARTELQRIYATDPLTKIGNRVRLESEAEKWLGYCRRHGLDLSLVLVDVDNLKQINDQYGHLMGDAILYDVAQLMRKQLRANDVCVRWGGDEFILLLPHTDAGEAQKLTERIKSSIQQHEFTGEITVTCSFGISDMKGGFKLDELISHADHLMYHDKKQSRTRA